MNGRRAYKSDVSFLEKISLGAVGTRKVFQDVAAQGHYPIELERGSMNFKIWKRIKIKRVRVPDILCIQCGKRVESRAKTSLEITMSHSTSTLERGWDFGLEENDYIALVKCIRSGEKPIDWVAEEPVQYVQVGNMREAYGKGLAFSEKPKGAGEGFEIRVTWPSSLARDDGEVISVDSKRIQYRNSKSGRVVTLRLSKRGVLLEPRVRVGEAVRKNQIIASVVPVVQRFDCDKTASGENYLSMLDSASLSDRYVSAKALAYFPSDNVADALTRVVRNDREHIYVRLEAASSLLRSGQTEYLSFFRGLLNDPYLENRLECVIVLGEIDLDKSCDLLVATLLDSNQHPEIRAGAAWSLGELRNKKATEALVRVFNKVETGVREEAARALMRFGDLYSKDIIRLLPTSTEEERAGIAWALSKSGQFEVTDLIRSMTDDETRKWIAWIVGTQDKAKYISQIEQLKHVDGEVYFAVTVLWKILSSWIAELDVY
ncbi:MAG: HEAT repeat domain-containing protein [Deltaproteobacteria bacterium]|nr:HEAT repeat domain-containing protein [Deltaproteobacteria bacterium]